MTIIQQSITSPNATIAGSLDATKPFTFIEWVKRLNVDLPESKLFSEYREYTNVWNIKYNAVAQDGEDLVKEAYIGLLKDLVKRYSSPSERAVLSKINWDDDTAVISVIPLLASKLKDIALYYQKKRQQVKAATALRGLRVEAAIVQNVIDAVRASSDNDINSLADTLTTDLNVTIDEFAHLVKEAGERVEFGDTVVIPTLETAEPAQTFVRTILQESAKYRYILSSINLAVTYSPNADIGNLKERDFVGEINTGNVQDLGAILRTKLAAAITDIDTLYISAGDNGTYTSGVLIRAEGNAYSDSVAIDIAEPASNVRLQDVGFQSPGHTTVATLGGHFTTTVNDNLSAGIYTFRDSSRVEDRSAPLTFIHDNSKYRRNISNAAAAGIPYTSPSTLTTHGYISTEQHKLNSLWVQRIQKHGYVADFVTDIYSNEYVKLSNSIVSGGVNNDFTAADISITRTPIQDVLLVLNGYEFTDYNYDESGTFVDPTTLDSVIQSGMLTNTNTQHTPYGTLPSFGPLYTSGSVPWYAPGAYNLWAGEFTSLIFENGVRKICVRDYDCGPFNVPFVEITTDSPLWPDQSAEYPYAIYYVGSVNSFSPFTLPTTATPGSFYNSLPNNFPDGVNMYGGLFRDKLNEAPTCTIGFGGQTYIRNSVYIDSVLSGANTEVGSYPLTADESIITYAPGVYYVRNSAGTILPLSGALPVIETFIPNWLNSTSKLYTFDDTTVIYTTSGTVVTRTANMFNDAGDFIPLTGIQTAPYHINNTGVAIGSLTHDSFSRSLGLSISLFNGTTSEVIYNDAPAELVYGGVIGDLITEIDKPLLGYNRLRNEYVVCFTAVGVNGKYAVVIKLAGSSRSAASALTLTDSTIVQI